MVECTLWLRFANKQAQLYPFLGKGVVCLHAPIHLFAKVKNPIHLFHDILIKKKEEG